MTRQAGVAPTLTVREIGGVVRRATHGGPTPECPKCHSSEQVVRMWHGKVKFWVCSACYKVGSTKTQPQSLKDRVLHRAPKQEEHTIQEVLPNRAARRRRK